MENQVMEKLETRLIKLNGRHLDLAARITVANGLTLSSLWYVITLWAGDTNFFNKIQSKLSTFIWAGRPRVDRNTICQSKFKGELGLLSVNDQYRAIAGNLMVWSLGPGSHPLRIILQSHIQDLSKRKWGVSNYRGQFPRGAALNRWVILPGEISVRHGVP